MAQEEQEGPGSPWRLAWGSVDRVLSALWGCSPSSQLGALVFCLGVWCVQKKQSCATRATCQTAVLVGQGGFPSWLGVGGQNSCGSDGWTCVTGILRWGHSAAQRGN